MAYQDRQLEWHRALTIHIVSLKAIWYESSFFAIRIRILNQIEYLPNEFFTLLTSKLCDEINDRQVSHGRYNILHVLRDTTDSGKFHIDLYCVIYNDYTDGLRQRMWNSEIVNAIYQGFCQLGSPVRSLVSELYRKCIIYGMSYICKCFEILQLTMEQLQTACDMNYSTQILSEVLGMHYAIAMTMSETIVWISLLPPWLTVYHFIFTAESY